MHCRIEYGNTITYNSITVQISAVQYSTIQNCKVQCGTLQQENKKDMKQVAGAGFGAHS